MDENTKTKIILDNLIAGRIINDQIAYNLCKTFRLSSIIHNLRRYGYNIQDNWETNPNTGNRYKNYFIPEKDRHYLNEEE